MSGSRAQPRYLRCPAGMNFERGQYATRLALGPEDLADVQSFRAKCFGLSMVQDSDAFDARCGHLLVHHTGSDQLVGYFRYLTLQSAQIADSYSAQFYDLSALEAYEGPMIEVGRFCLLPDWRDPDVVRLAWGAMTALVDHAKARMLFGCTSFAGRSAEPYADTFSFLDQRHKAPDCWQPLPRAPETIPLAVKCNVDIPRALRRMPPLLRSYLTMGGWVSDHAVVDAKMDTLHVFTALEVAKIPPARKKLLRALR